MIDTQTNPARNLAGLVFYLKHINDKLIISHLPLSKILFCHYYFYRFTIVNSDFIF